MADFYKKAIDFQKLLGEYNKWIGDLNYEEATATAGESGIPFQREQMSDVWDAFNEVELDRIRHYYGQKLALESEGWPLGAGYMLGHEVVGTLNEQLFEDTRGWGDETTGFKGSLYDMYVNALAAVDYGIDKGLTGEGLYKRMKTMNYGMPREEFEMYGRKALERIGYENE